MTEVNSRYFLVQRAEGELSSEIIKKMNSFDEKEETALTVNEWISVLNNVFHSHIGSIVKYEIRQERHGTESKPADRK